MNLKTILSAIGKGGLKVADAGAKLNLPIASQIDQIADVIQETKGKTEADVEKIGQALAGLSEIKVALQKPGTIEHKRLKVALLNGLAVVAIYAGFPPEVADQLALFVSGPIMAFILGDTVRPSKS